MNTKINKNMNKNALIKKRVAPTLRKMEIGDKEQFPATQWSSLMTARQRLNIQDAINFSIRRSGDNMIEVTRTI